MIRKGKRENIERQRERKRKTERVRERERERKRERERERQNITDKETMRDGMSDTVGQYE